MISGSGQRGTTISVMRPFSTSPVKFVIRTDDAKRYSRMVIISISIHTQIHSAERSRLYHDHYKRLVRFLWFGTMV